MTKPEGNRFLMYRAIEDVLDKFAAIITNIMSYADIYNRFRTIIQDISDNDNIYQNAKKGTIADKEIAENGLIRELLVKANVLFLISQKNNNSSLKAISNVSESGLKKLRETALLQKARLILNSFKKNTAYLKDFSMNDDALAVFQGKIDQYDSALNIKNLSQAESKSARIKLKELFKAADLIVRNELDKAAELIRSEHPDFYKEYKAARIVKDFGQPKSVKPDSGSTPN
jgi:hypothetical protein